MSRHSCDAANDKNVVGEYSSYVSIVALMFRVITVKSGISNHYVLSQHIEATSVSFALDRLARPRYSGAIVYNMLECED
jgi:hypothetical protein